MQIIIKTTAEENRAFDICQMDFQSWINKQAQKKLNSVMIHAKQIAVENTELIELEQLVKNKKK